MFQIDKEKVPIKMLTGYNKFLEGYPTCLDVLYDSCIESVDDSLFSPAKMENKYGIPPERIDEIHKELMDNKYIEKKVKNYRIVDTPWT